ncbi:MAG: hypothetical protein MZV65_28040 [Chromatiales bacterium]|nr:hypothetical protein [Chromatiales bacterium]
MRAGEYFVLTLHRPANVDRRRWLRTSAGGDRRRDARLARGLPGAPAHGQDLARTGRSAAERAAGRSAALSGIQLSGALTPRP